MSRPTKKRARNTPPGSWLDCQTLTQIPWMSASARATTAAAASLADDTVANIAMFETKLASQVTKEIFLERFRKEVTDRFHVFSVQKKEKKNLSSHDGESKDLQQAERRRTILKARILVGLSVCSKALLSSESDNGGMELIVLSSDYQPTHFAAHVPILARQRNIPILLLPNASTEMGKLLGIKCAGVMAFTNTAEKTASKNVGRDETEINEAVDSFVSFVKSKIA
eukprot:scaffold145_cov173-Amphora_coffeaeformis.AAC.4